MSGRSPDVVATDVVATGEIVGGVCMPQVVANEITAPAVGRDLVGTSGHAAGRPGGEADVEGMVSAPAVGTCSVVPVEGPVSIPMSTSLPLDLSESRNDPTVFFARDFVVARELRFPVRLLLGHMSGIGGGSGPSDWQRSSGVGGVLVEHSPPL